MSDSLPTETALPMALTTREQWLCWRAEERDGKPTKLPVDPASGNFASTTDPSTWADFETAHDRACSPSADAAGLGFVFTDNDPVVGIDLDDCRIPETGKCREWATEIIDRLDSYTEISPSGTGYHVLVAGQLPEGRNRKGDIELYETARFFTVTGDQLPDAPDTIEQRNVELEAVHREYVGDPDTEPAPESASGEGSVDSDPTTHHDSKHSTDTGRDAAAAPESTLSDKELVSRAKAAANGEKFERLWRGNTTGYESHSEADMALCSILAFWSGGDKAQTDRLFRESGLMRPKWDERHFADGSTYGEKTTERAIAGTDEFYVPPQSSSRSASASGSASTHASRNTRDSSALDNANSTESTDERLNRIETLETELATALDTIETVKAELATERDRRRALESELDAERHTETGWRSWLPWR